MDNTQTEKHIAQLRKALFLNELSGNSRYLYEFSDADGVRTGKSGYSFGLCQFDIMNNARAIRCLQECGFTHIDIARLQSQLGSISDLNAKLITRKAVIDKWDEVEISRTVRHVDEISAKAGIVYANDEAFIHACDYHNQYDMKPRGKAVTYLAALRRPVTAADILAYKYTTIWGKKRKDDVDRRFNNIAKIMGGTPV